MSISKGDSLLRDWIHGVHQLSQFDVERISFPDGILLEVSPAEASMDSILSMQRVLYMLQNYPGRFSFEIWKDNGFRFYFFSSARSAEGMIKSQLLSIYPQIKIERAKNGAVRLVEGEYLHSCSLGLRGAELNLRCPDDFHYDPVRHILEAMNACDSRVMVQILFERLRKIPKNRRTVVAQKYGDSRVFRGGRIPVMRCLIRAAAVSKEDYAAMESCGFVSRVFSVFDSDKCRLVPAGPFPLIGDSFRTLMSMVGRRFPMFSRWFMISVPELASMVHLPVGAESCGVEYVNPSLTPW